MILSLLNSKLNRLTDPQYHGLLDAVKNGMPLLANPWSVCFFSEIQVQLIDLNTIK